MASNEGLVIDSLNLNDGTSYLLRSLDMPDPPKKQEWADSGDSDGKALIRDPLFDNRTVTAVIEIQPQSTMNAALDKIAAIGDKLEEAEQRPDGLGIVYTPATSSRTFTLYCLSGEITDIPRDMSGDSAGFYQFSPVITVRFDCKPFGYGAEYTALAAVTSTAPLQTATIASVPGDVSAEARLVLTDKATKDRRFAEWGLEWLNYQSSTKLLLQNTDLTNTGFSGTSTTRTGSFSTNIFRGTLTTSGPVAVCGTGVQAHIGSFRVKVRIYVSSLAVRIRFTWRDGDGPLRSTDWAAAVQANAWCELDLGEISVTQALLGTQKWEGRFEAYTEPRPATVTSNLKAGGPQRLGVAKMGGSGAGVVGAAGDTVDIDYMLLIPTERDGYSRAPLPVTSPTSFSARDEFDQTAGALNAKTLPVGGTWATSGSATDLAVETAGHTAQKTAVSESFRYAIAGATNFTNVAVQADVKTSAYSGGLSQAVIARWTDSSNFLRAGITAGRTGPLQDVFITKVVAGAATILFEHDSSLNYPVNTWTTIRLVISATGQWLLFVYPQGTTPVLVGGGADTDLATGGTLATGKPGFLDINNAATACTRNYDNFATWAPVLDAVAFSGQAAEFRSADAVRYDSTGVYTGRPPINGGARFFLPPAGDQNRTTRIAARLRRNDISFEVDDQIADNQELKVLATPRWRSIPKQ